MEAGVAKVACNRMLAALAGAVALALAMPVSGQLYSDGYAFLKAVEEKDGTKVTEMLDAPGTTLVNARELSTGRTAMHIVVARRDLTWINFLSQKGASADVQDTSGVTPLMLASQLNFIEGVEALVRHGARVDVTNNAGETPLMSAVHARNTELMRVLLEAGADPDRYDNSGRSARDYALLRGERDVTVQTIERYQKPESERETANTTYGPTF